MSYPKHALLIRPYTWLELPGWGTLYRLSGAAVPPGSTRWQDAPVKVIRGKFHGYRMELHLSDWAERMTYFLGRYYELPIQQLLADALERGDRCVDVGGNIGMVTLVAAKCVGSDGLVDVFEPNPVCQNRLQRMLDINEIDWVRLHPVGLSDVAETLELTVVHGHTGVGTFAPMHVQASAISQKERLEVVSGDDVLLQDPRRIRFIKIDVEGFETRALRGLSKVLERDHPIVVTETFEENLRRGGSSIAELFELMQSYGYAAFTLGLKRSWLRHKLSLRPAQHAGELDQSDTLWLHKSDGRMGRLLASYQAD